MFKKSTHFDLLVYLLEHRANEVPLKASTTELGDDLGVSQQTVSRWLIEMEQAGFLERKHEGIMLLPLFMEQMEELYHTLKDVYEAPDSFTLEGELVRGMSDGKYYLGLPGYTEQVKEKLGFTPFEGTLNVLLKSKDMKKPLLYAHGIDLEGFFQGGRTLGSAKCFPCKVNGKVDGAIIIPLRSHHGPEVLEIISSVDLRKKLKLKDGDRVEVEVLR